MTTSRLQLGTCAIVALVLLRLAIGWHFFREGTDKVAYDASEGRYRVVFSAEGFFSQAVGPLAGLFHAQVPNLHDWPALLAVPRQDAPLTPEQESERAKWLADDAERAAAATKEGRRLWIVLPPFAPWYDWENRIAGDWMTILAQVVSIPNLSEEQGATAAETFVRRQQQLVDYLSAESDAIKDYQHGLWRLEQMKAAPEAAGVPYQVDRIAAKEAELRGSPAKWVGEVAKFEQYYFNDLRSILTPDQKADAATAAAMDDLLTDPRQARLNSINLAVTVLTLGVGACLLLGFFTRLSSLVGALFLLGVIATQPPWVPGAANTYYQTVELAGLLVLCGAGAGRWFGLDFFTYALCRRCCPGKAS